MDDLSERVTASVRRASPSHVSECESAIAAAPGVHPSLVVTQLLWGKITKSKFLALVNALPSAGIMSLEPSAEGTEIIFPGTVVAPRAIKLGALACQELESFTTVTVIGDLFVGQVDACSLRVTGLAVAGKIGAHSLFSRGHVYASDLTVTDVHGGIYDVRRFICRTADVSRIRVSELLRGAVVKCDTISGSGAVQVSALRGPCSERSALSESAS